MRRLILLLSSLAANIAAQPLSYTLLTSDGAKPSPRFDGTIAYEPDSRQVYLFGGSDGAAKNDLWAYSLAQRRWTEVQPSGDKPPARWGQTFVFDPVRRRLIVFGGQASGFFSDTWAFDLASGSWRQLAGDAAGPSRRYGHSGVYDAARDRMIISHGFTDAGRFDDTWAFEFATNTWRNVSPPARPLRRCLHHAVLDAANNQMLLYGGCASGAGPCPLGDLWSFDLTAHRWTEITGQTKPAPRDHYGIVFNSVRRRLTLFGGAGGGTLNDTWDFDPASRIWNQPTIEGPPPSPRSRHESAFAADRGTAFFFGGSTSAGLTNELWMLGPGLALTRPEVSQNGVSNAFSGLPGAVAPGQIASIYGSGLGPLEGITFAFDSLTGRLPVSGPGVSVKFNGVPAPLYYAQSGQLNVQVPYELQGSSQADLVVTVNGSTSTSVTLPVVPTKPALFPRSFHASGSAVTPDNPASPGEIVILFATGQGITNPAIQTGALAAGSYPEPVATTILRVGGQPAETLFLGLAPGTAGVLQINARIPANAAAGELPVVLTVGEADSQPGVTIAVR